MFNYKVEKGIPMQEPRELKFPFSEMDIGDSFYVPLNEWVYFGGASGIAISASIQKVSYIVCAVDGGFRVWRSR